MSLDPEITATANSDFARTLLCQAAELFSDGQPESDHPNAYAALVQARNNFLTQKSSGAPAKRTYTFPQLSTDLADFIRRHYPEYADKWVVISQWSQEQDPDMVVRTLQESAVIIGEMVAERTRTASKIDLMSEKERCEYFAMRKATAFLKQQGVAVEVEWEREDPEKDPIDYFAYVEGTRWAFELTELRKDAPGSHLKVGHPRSTKSVDRQLADLSAPIPKVPDDAKSLLAALNKAVAHGNQKSKLDALDGAKYCLLVHNQQFLYEPSWLDISYPDLRGIDVVLMLHSDDLTPAHAWEVIPPDRFGKPVKSQNISDLADIEEFKASGRKGFDRDEIRAAWATIPDIEEADLLQAIQDL